MIDTKAIRSKILDAAVRGLLTQQLPEDGTAEELYQQIQKEKQKLIESGKIKREKPLPEISEEEIPFEIPENWKWVRIGEVFTLQSGKAIETGTIQENKDNDNKYPCFGGNGLRGFVKQSNVNGYHAIIGRQGALCGNINFANGEFYATEHAVVVYEYSNTNMTWAGLVLKALNLNQYATSVAQPGLAVSKINLVLLPLPPLAEQRRIVERIEQIFSLLDEIDELQARYTDNLAALKSKLIDAAIQGKLTEQLPEDGTAEELYQQIQKEKQKLIEAGKIKKEKPLPEITEDEIPFEIPENWMWVRLGDYMDVRDGTHESPDFYEEGYPLVTSKNLKNGEVDLSNVKYISKADYDSINLRSKVDEGDILFAMIGSIGNPAIVGKEHVYAIKNVALFKKIIPECNEYYIYYYFYLVQFTMREKARGGLQPFVSLSNLRRYLLPLPPLSEQRRIVECLEELLALCGG